LLNLIKIAADRFEGKGNLDTSPNTAAHAIQDGGHPATVLFFGRHSKMGRNHEKHEKYEKIGTAHFFCLNLDSPDERIS
jgi:hypothetical protein